MKTFLKGLAISLYLLGVPEVAKGQEDNKVNSSTSYQAIGYFGGTHFLTELTLKTTHLVMRDYYEISKYNRMFSTTLVGLMTWQVMYQMTPSTENRAANTIGIITGLITGNLMQYEW